MIEPNLAYYFKKRHFLETLFLTEIESNDNSNSCLYIYVIVMNFRHFPI